MDASKTDRNATDVVDLLFHESERLHNGFSVSREELIQADPLRGDGLAALLKRFNLVVSEAGLCTGQGSNRWRVRWLRPGDEAEWLRLFSQAFGYHMDPAFLHWKYRHMTVWGSSVWQDGELIAFFGGMSRPIRYRGEAVEAVQVGDVMVHPKARGVLTRTGPFQMAAATYFERCVGFNRPYLLAFGFPTSKHLRLGTKIGLYHVADEMVELAWSCVSTSRSAWWRWRDLSLTDRETAEQLWAAMRGDFADEIIGVRDWPYLLERYVQHPTVRYTCLLVTGSLTRKATGILVFREQEGDTLEWMDVIGRRSRLGTLVRIARAYAHHRMKSELRIWMTRSHVHDLATGSPTVRSLDLWVPGNSWHSGPALDAVANRWWLTGGDTDFR